MALDCTRVGKWVLHAKRRAAVLRSDEEKILMVAVKYFVNFW